MCKAVFKYQYKLIVTQAAHQPLHSDPTIVLAWRHYSVYSEYYTVIIVAAKEVQKVCTEGAH